MILKTLTIKITGQLWKLDTVEVENVDVTDQWEDNDTGGAVTLKNVNVSTDDVLDVFIALGAPNGTRYTVGITGETQETTPVKLNYTEDFEVVKNGRLKISISKTLNELSHG